MGRLRFRVVKVMIIVGVFRVGRYREDFEGWGRGVIGIFTFSF